MWGQQLGGSFIRVVLTLCVVAFSACQNAVATGLDEASANEVVVALHGRGIGATKEASGGGSDATYQVLVASDDVAPALAAMRDEALPRPAGHGFDEVFQGGGLVPTPTEERARFLSGLSGELERSLLVMDSVLAARVHLALPERSRASLSNDNPLPPRASVLLRTRAGMSADEEAVRALVAGAVPRLEASAISVISTPQATPAAASERLVQVGPITVTQGSSTALKAVLGGAIGVIALLAIGMVFLARRRREPPVV